MMGENAALIAERYVRQIPGNCHVIPNHALVILPRLWARPAFQDAMRIANTAGWDTDCNAGNVGCLFASGPGLQARRGARLPHARSPTGCTSRPLMARIITDAVIEAQSLISTGHASPGAEPSISAKTCAFNFNFPGSLQGFASKNGIAGALAPGRDRQCRRPQPVGRTQPSLSASAPGARRVARVAKPTFFRQGRLHDADLPASRFPTLIIRGRPSNAGWRRQGGGKITVRLYATSTTNCMS